jgi:hypothetical protein
VGRRLTLWLGQRQPAVSCSCLATRTTTRTSRAVGLTSGVAVIVATTLSSCRRTAPSLMCIESEGVVANFSARAHTEAAPRRIPFSLPLGDSDEGFAS